MKWNQPGRKDYIAIPKANMYQSIHTVIIPWWTTSENSNPYIWNANSSCWIRVAAHWAYKEGNKEKVTYDPLQKQLDWFKDLIEFQNETKDAKDFMNSVKEDTEVRFVFTPKQRDKCFWTLLCLDRLILR